MTAERAPTLPVTMRGRVMVERRVVAADRQRVTLVQTFVGSGERVVVTHGAAVLALVVVEAGELRFAHVDGEVAAPRRFWMVLPRRQTVRMRFVDARVRSEGVADFAIVLPGDPRLVATDAERLPEARAGALEIGRQPGLLAPADAATRPAMRAARERLHDLIAHPAPVRATAASLGIHADALTRGFAQVYGVSPKQYCHRARLFEAALLLLTGAAILDVAFDAGFNDLSRFYAQFRRQLGTTPGTYARVGKRQDPAADSH